ncbi:MAG: hypothetical protein J6V60_02890 [Muribaculaceae bacterium]|nr:hypothetical protein [Muribaculaceae bacterium]
MDVRFKYNEPSEAEKIYFEQIFAEKPGGGIVSNPGVDYPPSTSVYESNGKFYIYPTITVIEEVSADSSKIKVKKTDIMTGFPIAFGKKAINILSKDDLNAEYDVLNIRVAFGVKIPAGTKLYIATEESDDDAVPGITPVFVTGDWVYANQGDQAVRLINGANLRKETANIASEVAALLPGINLV